MKLTSLISAVLSLGMSLVASCAESGGEIPPPFTPSDDVQFIDGMVPHHEGAVLMADMILLRSQRSELKAMAQQIIQ